MPKAKTIKTTKAEKAAAEPSVTDRPEFEVFQMLRTCGPNMEGSAQRLNKNGRSVDASPFIWKENKVLVAEDYTPEAVCGGGLHGLKNGQGSWGLLDWSGEAKAVIFENVDCPVIDIDGDKVKCEKAKIVETGSLPALIAKLFIPQIIVETQLSPEELKDALEKLGADASMTDEDESKQAASGDESKQAASGSYSTQAASGYGSKQAASGSYSTQAASGYGSKQAASGDESKQAASGSYSTQAASGKNAVSMAAGIGGTVKTGVNGAVALTYKDSNGRCRIAVGYAGENIKPDVSYQVDSDGQFIEV